MTPAAIVSKLWNYCHVLRDDLSACGHAQAGGMSYLLARYAQASGDYIEQLTYLLFLKMADERTRPPWTVPASGLPARGAQAGAHKQPSAIPAGFDWPNLLKRDGDDLPAPDGAQTGLFDHYRHTLEELGKQKGLLGLIFNKSQNKVTRPIHRPRPYGHACARPIPLS
jgi:type I restriction enzyme M protein